MFFVIFVIFFVKKESMCKQGPPSKEDVKLISIFKLKYPPTIEKEIDTGAQRLRNGVLRLCI